MFDSSIARHGRRSSGRGNYNGWQYSVAALRARPLFIAIVTRHRVGRRDRHFRRRRSWCAGAQGRKQHAVVAAFGRSATDKFDPHVGGPLLVEVKRLGGTGRKIDDAMAYKGPAIVDPHDDRAAIVQIGDTGIARQRHGAVRRRDAVHVIALAVRGLVAMEVGSIPGCNAFAAIHWLAGWNRARSILAMGFAV